MDTLAKLFSSGTLVRVMRLFLFNPHGEYDVDDIVERTRSQKKKVSYEVKLLVEIGFLRQKSFFKTIDYKSGPKKKRVKGWVLDAKFPYLAPLKVLLVNTDLMNRGELEKRLGAVGKIDLIAAAGVFMQEAERRIDLLIVGEKIQQPKLLRAIKEIEGIIGTELRYSVLAPEDFEYRLSVRDKLTRDLFEYPHFLVRNKFKKMGIL